MGIRLDEPPPRLDCGLPPAPSDVDRVGDQVRLPRPTAWPPVLAFGVMMLGAGLLLSYLYSAISGFFNYTFTVLGATLTVFGIGGWVRNLRPGRGHVLVPLEPPEDRAPLIRPSPREVEEQAPEKPQVWVTRVAPLRPYRTGLKGGVWGGIAMALVAVLTGLFRYGSVWFAVNCLAAVVVPDLAVADEETLRRFSLGGLLAGIAMHIGGSLTTGIFMAATLPAIYSKVGRIVMGGAIMPIVWVLVLWWLLPVISPPMGRYVPWFWFSVSQIAYAVVAVLIIEHAQAPYRKQLQQAEQGGQFHG
jgi:hypothetical protein